MKKQRKARKISFIFISLLFIWKYMSIRICCELEENASDSSLSLETVDFNYKFYLFVHHPLPTMSDEETFLCDFQVILKRLIQNYLKISKKCFFSTTWTVMLSAGSNRQPHPRCVTFVKEEKSLQRKLFWIADKMIIHNKINLCWI